MDVEFLTIYLPNQYLPNQIKPLLFKMLQGG